MFYYLEHKLYKNDDIIRGTADFQLTSTKVKWFMFLCMLSSHERQDQSLQIFRTMINFGLGMVLGNFEGGYDSSII